jgi:hypothetical protein
MHIKRCLVAGVFVLGLIMPAATRAAAQSIATPGGHGSGPQLPPELRRTFKEMPLSQQSLKVHGPFLLSAREISHLIPSERDDGPDVDDEGDGGDPPCRDAASCGGAPPGEGSSTPTPPPNEVFGQGLTPSDPQISAGANFLVSTAYDQIGFYDKAGNLLIRDKNNQPIAYPISTLEFFKNLTNDINANLNLPPPSTGATVANGWGITHYYDSRTIYDSYRKRFWIIALARNDKALGQTDPFLQGARRGKIAVAVSLTEDPRDGWNTYWWESEYDDALCNNPIPCIGEHGSDYPSIGISKLYVTTENGGGNKTIGHFYPYVTVFPADQLANGCAQNCVNGVAFWDFVNEDGSPNPSNLIQPAVHHGNAYPLMAFFATNFQGDGKAWLSAWMYFNGKMFLSSVPISAYSGPVDAPQQATAAFVNPYPLRIANVGNNVLKASFRGTKLYATFSDCKLWPGQPLCMTAIRLVRADVGNMVAPEIDRTFGERNVNDPPSVTAVSYGTPALEVNKNGDIVVVYIRAGTTLFGEARYSVFRHNAPDISPSAVLQVGQGVIGGDCTASPCKGIGNLDVGGISVDGGDDTAIWIAHGYSNNVNSWNIAIGKVLGRPQTDLNSVSLTYSIGRGRITPLPTVLAMVNVSNTGDSSVASAQVGLYLFASFDAPAPLYTLKEFTMGPLAAAGGTASKNVGALLTPNIKPGTYVIGMIVDPHNHLTEYSKINNQYLAGELVVP